MGKMSDLDLQIKELRSCGETIIEIANTLAGMFSSQAAEDAPPEAGVAPQPAKIPRIITRANSMDNKFFLHFISSSSFYNSFRCE